MSSLDLRLNVMAEISTSPSCICGLMVWRISSECFIFYPDQVMCLRPMVELYKNILVKVMVMTRC